MVDLARGLVGIAGTTLRIHSEGYTYVREHGTPPPGIDRQFTEQDVIDATRSFLATLNEHSAALGSEEVEHNLNIAAEVVRPVSAVAERLVLGASRATTDDG